MNLFLRKINFYNNYAVEQVFVASA